MIRCPVRAVVFMALAASAAHLAEAGVRTPVGSTDPTPLRWDLADLGSDRPEVVAGELVFRLDGAGSDDVADGSDLAAIEAAFAAWSGMPHGSFAARRGADLAERRVAEDDSLSVFWVEGSPVHDNGTPDPSDDIDVSGALAVTFVWWLTGGTERGEIVDADIVFNGADWSWTTDPANDAGAFDVGSIATHEAGHAIGLSHSPVGGASMFPRTGPGDPSQRGLSRDDESTASGTYPDTSRTLETAEITGVVLDGAGDPLRGAHVVAADEHGGVIGSTLTAADGSYRLDGIAPGEFAAWAEPLDPPDGRPWLFTPTNLPSYWRSSTDLDFHTSAEVEGTAFAGSTHVVDFTVTAGSPARDVELVGRDGAFRNAPLAVTAGEKDVTIGVAAPTGLLPASGTPLSISGDGFVVGATSFPSLSGRDAVAITVDVDPDATPGLRSLVIEDGSGRTVASGHVEVRPPSGPIDSDGDTLSDAEEGEGDPDGDGTPNRLDLDSDGDTILDAHEAGDADLETPARDSDGDGTPDFLDLDSDDDSVSDADEACDADPTTAPCDTDGDSLPDALDLDSDGDGIPDAVEAGDLDPLTPPRDTDGDALPDLRDLDSDGDGLSDLDEGVEDLDSDGDGAWRDTDRDDGGEPDGVEVAWGRDPDVASDDVTERPERVPTGALAPPLVVARSGATLVVDFSPAERADRHRLRSGPIEDLRAGAFVAPTVACDLDQPSWSSSDAFDGGSVFYVATGWNRLGEGPAGPGRALSADCP